MCGFCLSLIFSSCFSFFFVFLSHAPTTLDNKNHRDDCRKTVNSRLILLSVCLFVCLSLSLPADPKNRGGVFGAILKIQSAHIFYLRLQYLYPIQIPIGYYYYGFQSKRNVCFLMCDLPNLVFPSLRSPKRDRNPFRVQFLFLVFFFSLASRELATTP